MRVLAFASVCWLTLMAVGMPSSSLSAQIPQLSGDCDLQSYRVLTSQEVFPGRRVTWVGRPVLVCPDGAQVQADSAVLYEETARTEFIGQVHFRNVVRELRAARADYYERDGRLVARGDVELLDLIQGSEIRGDSLEMLQANHLRMGDWLAVSGGRPTALLRGTPGVDGAPAPEPYHVTGNRLRFEDDRYLWADGDGVIEQGDFRATADSIFFDQVDGDLRLNGQARLEQAGSELEGRRIQVVLVDQELRTITAQERGRLTTSDLLVSGEYLRLFFAADEMERLVAVHRGSNETDVGPPRPQILADEFSLVADSLDILSPAGRLETVNAIGRARGESLGQESASRAPVAGVLDGEDDFIPDDGEDEFIPDDAEDEFIPDDAEDVDIPIDGTERASPNVGGPGIADRDWIEGDEILAVFMMREDTGEAPTETPPSQYVLDRLVATGSARTLYRSIPEDRNAGASPAAAETPADGRWALSYVLADLITVFLLEGNVERIEAEGEVRGVQLEPIAGEARPPEAVEGEIVNE